MLDTMQASVAAQMCGVLEEEFALLHGQAAEAQAPGSSPEQRNRALNARIDALDGDETRSALSLSGGGIRSATFCLGALQALAKVEALGKFHYLSTVSGGGYVGGLLSSWIQREGLGWVLQALTGAPSPAGGSDATPAGGPHPVNRLRAYTNYLSPVWGFSLDALTLVATFLRNLALHWLVVLPLLFAVLLLPRLQVAVQTLTELPAYAPYAALGLGVLCIFCAVAYVAADLPGEPQQVPPGAPPPPRPRNHFVLGCMFPLFVGALLISWAGAWIARAPDDPLLSASWATAGWFAAAGAALHLLAAGVGWLLRRERSLQARRYTFPVRALVAAATTGALGGIGQFGFLCAVIHWQPPLHGNAIQSTDMALAMGWHDIYAMVSVPALLMVFWAAVTFFVGAMSRLTSEEDREWWARASATSLAWSLGWVALVLVVLCLPYWILLIPGLRDHSDAKTIVGAGTGLLGAAISAFGYWSKRGPAIKEQVETWATRLGVRALDIAALAFVVLLAVVISFSTSYTLDRLPHLPLLSLEAYDESKEQRITQMGSAQFDAKINALLDTNVCSGKALDPCVLKAASRRNKDPAARYAAVLRDSPLWLVALLIGLLTVSGVGWMMAIGVNTFSLHGMYGNRLVRAYLGAARVKRMPHWFSGFDPDDDMPMAALKVKDRRLFPVVNAALNLARAAGGRLEWQERKAASFTITPLHCGSPELGFVHTQAYGRPERKDDPRRPPTPSHDQDEPSVDQKLGGLSLGRAMTISGAAASPNMGYHTSKLVAFAMSFFNVRLGLWLPNPKRKFDRYWTKREPTFGLGNVLAEATAGTSDTKSFVYLSDGGHFENLGLYEMVRRRCRRLVVLDATADPNYVYADLESSIRKMRIDLGAEITFPHGLPTADSVKRTGRHFAIGIVAYPDSEHRGRIVYIKPALSGDEPLDVTHYAASQKRRDAAFPHDPTSHQNFDEAQFESYRMLGWHSVLDAFASGSPWRADVDPDHRPPAGSEGGAGGGKGGAPASPASGGGGGLRNVAAGALLGSLAVTGTVALKDNQVVIKNPEVSLSPAQVTLADGASVSLRPDSLKIETDLGAAVDALARTIGPQTAASQSGARAANDAASAANRESVNLIATLDRLEQTLRSRDNTPEVRVQINQLRLELEALRQRALTVELSATSRDRLDAAATAFANAARALERQSAKAPVDLGEVTKALNKIAQAVENTTPRRNVSGTGEGAR